MGGGGVGEEWELRRNADFLFLVRNESAMPYGL